MSGSRRCSSRALPGPTRKGSSGPSSIGRASAFRCDRRKRSGIASGARRLSLRSNERGSPVRLHTLADLRSRRGHRMGLRPAAVPAGAPLSLDARLLEADLRRRIRGEVRFDDGSRALYATDASNYRHVPIGVVVPRTVADVIEAVAAAREAGAPLPRGGGGTSLAGQCCNVAVVIDCSKYLNRVVELDPAKRFARVQPGCVLDDLRDEALRHSLTFAPDPSTHTHCTLGGMIGNNSCGVHSVMAGKTSDNIDELEVLPYDGTRFTAGATPDEGRPRTGPSPGPSPRAGG